MTVSKGKAFEQKFKKDFLKLGDCTCDRLLDVTYGYKSVGNVSDFICYKYPNIFYIECKEHKGNTFPLANVTQYERLLPKAGIPGVRAGVVLWMSEKQIVVYLPVKTIEKMLADGKKSFNATKDLSSDYRIIQIPSVALRTFMDSDYSVLLDLNDGD